jgi:hypothetical protein
MQPVRAFREARANPQAVVTGVFEVIIQHCVQGADAQLHCAGRLFNA